MITRLCSLPQGASKQASSKQGASTCFETKSRSWKANNKMNFLARVHWLKYDWPGLSGALGISYPSYVPVKLHDDRLCVGLSEKLGCAAGNGNSDIKSQRILPAEWLVPSFTYYLSIYLQDDNRMADCIGQSSGQKNDHHHHHHCSSSIM